MHRCEFIVSLGACPAAAWGKIAEVAEAVGQPGACIRVHDEKGNIASMMGVVAADALARPSAVAQP